MGQEILLLLNHFLNELEQAKHQIWQKYLLLKEISSKITQANKKHFSQESVMVNQLKGYLKSFSQTLQSHLELTDQDALSSNELSNQQLFRSNQNSERRNDKPQGGPRQIIQHIKSILEGFYRDEAT